MVEVRTDGHELPDELAVIERDEQRDVPAVAEADQVRRATDDHLEDAEHLDRHVGVVERRVGVGRAAVAPSIERDDAVVLCERRADRAEQVVAARQPPVQQEDRLVTRPCLLDPRGVPSDVDVATHRASVSTWARQ